MLPRILITGATGTVGGALLRALATAHKEGKITVVAGARSAATRKRLAALGVEVVHLDYDDAASVCEAPVPGHEIQRGHAGAQQDRT